MQDFVTTRGSRQVKTVVLSGGRFLSRLYVNDGATATTHWREHKTEQGARQWARQVLDFQTKF